MGRGELVFYSREVPAAALRAMIGREFKFGLHDGFFEYHLLGLKSGRVAVFSATRFRGVEVLRDGFAGAGHVFHFTP